MHRFMHGRNQTGFSYIEMMFVLSIFSILTGLGYLLYNVSRGERYTVERASSQVLASLTKARSNAWNGVEDPSARTFKLANIPLPQGAAWVTQADTNQFNLKARILTVEDTLEFDPQTARTHDKSWGIVIVKDLKTQTEQAIVITYLNAAPQRMVKYAGQTTFQPMSNSVY